ncbi:MAG: RES family NAD+ phosphorylase [Cytophagales bacterium]|nr:RES family NAD+ phosphorylase [Cytophagales bacterium]
MSDYFRIIQKKYSGSPLGYGTGGARWNARGVPMIYAGSSVSIITSEFLSIKGGAVVEEEWSLVSYSISSDPPFLDTTSLPVDWDSRPYPLSTQEFGRTWARRATSVCLKVPSSRILLKAYPKEHNLLINPLHPNLHNEVTVISIDDLFFNLNEWATGDK